MVSSDGKDGEPTIEEILASIRRIICDRPLSSPNIYPAVHVPPPLREDLRTDDDDAFELPAIFRSLQPRIDPLPPQGGDVHGDGHSADWQRDIARLGRQENEVLLLEPPGDLGRGDHAYEAGTAPGRSALFYSHVTKAPGSEPPAHADDGASLMPSTSSSRVSFSQLPTADIPRQMVECRDTLVAGRMVQPRLRAWGEPARDVLSRSPSPRVDFGYGPIIPAEFRAPGTRPSAPEKSSTESQEQAKAAASSAATSQGSIDRAAVELVRPLLQQWLDNNMRSIIESALREEFESARNKEQ